jgi:hypothetical protein
MPTVCDKCGGEVPWENDATIIESFYHGRPAMVFFYHSRHFLPVGECEGSPSRAQYIEGQPRDTRGFPYEPKREPAWRDAYARTQLGPEGSN